MRNPRRYAAGARQRRRAPPPPGARWLPGPSPTPLSSPCASAAEPGQPLPQDAGVAHRVATRLRPDTRPVGPLADLDRGRSELPALRADGVHLAVVATRQPQDLAVGRDAPHVGAAVAAVEHPLDLDRACRQVDHADTALVAVGHVEPAGVPAGVQAVGSLPGVDELDLLEGEGVDDVESVLLDVGDVVDAAVSRQLDVLGRTADVHGLQDLLVDHVDEQELAVEFAAGDGGT